MRYPEKCSSIVDITKAPYFADPTGKVDCTAALCRALNDCLRGYVTGMEQLREKLLRLHSETGGDVYVGAECGRIVDGNLFMTLPETNPPAKVIYFPNGIYTVSDTVCYTLENLFAPQSSSYCCELCRNIHLLGESREGTVIRLKDNCPGFSEGEPKPLISFNRAHSVGRETTNCAQMNTLEDLTVDCGRGNPDAVAVLYASSNCGRVENVTLRTGDGKLGMDMDYSAEGVFRNIKICGFDVGIRTELTCPVILDKVDFSECRKVGVRSHDGNVCIIDSESGVIPMLQTEKSAIGRYALTAGVHVGNPEGNMIYNDIPGAPQGLPERNMTRDTDFVLVDDFGAVGDGVTDSTAAIQRALNSGASIIMFNEGAYLIEQTIRIPKTVKVLDFMYATLACGKSLLVGSVEAMFDICEDSDSPLFVEHLLTGEECSGFFRVFRHSCQRTVVFRDITSFAALYYNTVSDGQVFFDNTFILTGHYSQDAELHRNGYVPVFCRMIPVELHETTAVGWNLNIERGDIELLNDQSSLTVFGYKVEGPGTLVKNKGGETRINLFNAAWWGNKLENNALFLPDGGNVTALGGFVFCYPKEERLAMLWQAKDCTGESLQQAGIPLVSIDGLRRDLGVCIDCFVLSGE